MGAKMVQKVGKRGQHRGSGQDTMPGLVGDGGHCIWLGNGMRDCVVVAGWKGMDCGIGPSMGGQHWLVLDLGVGLQVVGRKPGEDRGRES